MGAVIRFTDITGVGGEGFLCDGQVANKIQRGKIAPDNGWAASGNRVITCGDVAAAAGARRARGQRERGRAARAVNPSRTVARAARLGERFDHAAVIQILRADYGVGRRCAIGNRGVGHFHQQLICRNDGVIPADVVDIVVAGSQPRRNQHPGVVSGRIGNSAARAHAGARNSQRATQYGRGFPPHQAGIAHAVISGGVRLRDKLGIGIGGHRQGCRGDVGGQSRRLRNAVVARIRAGQDIAADRHRFAVTDIFSVKCAGACTRHTHEITTQ